MDIIMMVIVALPMIGLPSVDVYGIGIPDHLLAIMMNTLIFDRLAPMPIFATLMIGLPKNHVFDRVAPMLTFVTLPTHQAPSQVQHLKLSHRFNVYSATYIYIRSLSPVFTAPSHVTVMGYCDKQPNLIAAGCNSGQVI